MALITQDGVTKDFKVRDLPSIWSLTTPQKWVVQDLIPEGTVTMISGESGCGKSSICLLLADAVSKGKPFMERETTQKEVLIVDRENGLSIYHERLSRFNIGENPNIHFWGLWNDPEPLGPGSVIIREFIEECSPLVIFDSLIAFHPGDESDSAETREYMDLYRKLAGLGATVVIIHHTGKGETTKQYRGSSDIKASIDVGILLEQVRPLLQMVKITPFKSREGVVQPTLICVEGSGEVSLIANKDRNLILDYIASNPDSSGTQITLGLPQIPDYKVRKLLKDCEDNHLVEKRAGDKHSYLYRLPEGSVEDNL